jgi:hypothetical protein
VTDRDEWDDFLDREEPDPWDAFLDGAPAAVADKAGPPAPTPTFDVGPGAIHDYLLSTGEVKDLPKYGPEFDPSGVEGDGPEVPLDVLAHERGRQELMADVRAMQSPRGAYGPPLGGDPWDAFLGGTRDGSHIQSLPEAALKSTGRGALGVAASTVEGMGLAMEMLPGGKFSRTQYGGKREGFDEASHKIAVLMREWGEEHLERDPTREGEFFAETLPEALGSSLMFGAAGGAGMLVGVPPWMTIAFTGAMANGAPEYYEHLAARPGDELGAMRAFLIGAGVGTGEAVPLAEMLTRINKASGGTLQRMMLRAATEGFLEEGPQEGLQAAVSALIAHHMRDEDVDVWEEFGKGYKLGALTGVGLSSVSSYVAAKREVAAEKAEAEAKKVADPRVDVGDATGPEAETGLEGPEPNVPSAEGAEAALEPNIPPPAEGFEEGVVEPEGEVAPARMIKPCPKGECFRNAGKGAMNDMDGDTTLVHGFVTNAEGERLEHAWTESGNRVTDPTQGVEMDKGQWYALVQAEPMDRYTGEQAAVNMARSGNWGPWTAEEASAKWLEAETGVRGPPRKLQPRGLLSTEVLSPL